MLKSERSEAVPEVVSYITVADSGPPVIRETNTVALPADSETLNVVWMPMVLGRAVKFTIGIGVTSEIVRLVGLKA